jgi:hypothetical protein
MPQFMQWAAAATTGWPQLAQNLAPAGFAAEQFAQVAPAAAPPIAAGAPPGGGPT